MHPPEQNPSQPQGGSYPPFDMFEPTGRSAGQPPASNEVTQQIPLRWPQPQSPQQLPPPPPTAQQPPPSMPMPAGMPRRPAPEEFTEPMAERRRPPAPPGGRTRPTPPVPIVAEEPPLYRRTGPVVGVAVGVALLLGVGLGVAGYALTGGRHGASTEAAAPTATSTSALSPDPVTAASVTQAMPPLPPPPSAAPTTTTTTKAAASTTTAEASSSTSAAPVTGRFSGTVTSKNGNTWVVTGWDGTQTTVHVTGATKYSGTGFEPGQTVNIFWHSSGSSLVADSVYGMS